MSGRAELKCKIYPFGTLSSVKYVVVCSVYDGKYMLSQHKKRDTWETQGGHIEENETPMEAAKRELFEESGVTDAYLYPVCDYNGYDETGSANGTVFFAKIHKLGSLPNSEMKRVEIFNSLPNNLTYPNVTPVLFEKALSIYKE